MRIALVAALPLALAACETETRIVETTVVTPVSQAATDACIAAAARARAVEPRTVIATGAEATAGGPSLILSVNGERATCLVDANAVVRTLTFG